ncbi:transmembrane protein 214 isoform X2 [Engraulis encrasicolus]
MRSLDVSELKQQLERSQSLFPENPSVWVKDLAGYLNFKLPAPDSDPTLSTYAHDYPYCLAGKELRAIIKNLLSKSGETLQDFFDHCLLTMLREQDKPSSESLHGYRICIQAILQDKPKIATLNLADHLELLRSNQNRPVKCLTIMWALGQAGFYDLSQGLRVWLGIMLPVLGMKSLSSYAIAYLERLLMLHSNLTKGFGIMGPKELFPLLDFAYMPKNALSASLQEQLKRLYPRLKVLAFGAKPESSLHTYFPSFLSRATPNCPEPMKRELLSSLTECLSVDAHSLGVWRQLYTKYLSQSSLLLNHLLTCWKTLPIKLRSSLQETIQSFRVTNEQLGDCEGVEECNVMCSSIQMKMRGRGFPWSRLLMALLVFAVGFVAHDVRSHGSFAASSTSHYLHSSGVADLALTAWARVVTHSQQGFSWCEENMPYYYSMAVERVGPVMEDGWEKSKMAAAFMATHTSQGVEWIKENTPKLIEWINNNTPEGLVAFLEYLRELLLLLHEHYVMPALQYILQGLQHAWTTFQDSCNGEVSLLCLQNHAVSFTNSTWIYLQHTTASIRDWAQDLLSRA